MRVDLCALPCGSGPGRGYPGLRVLPRHPGPITGGFAKRLLILGTERSPLNAFVALCLQSTQGALAN